MKIDCSLTENFFKEKIRMTKNCTIICSDCLLRISNNGTEFNCHRLEQYSPEISIRMVQAWSDANPQKTYLEDLLEKYPDYKLNEKGVPAGCFKSFGYKMEKCPIICFTCWNQIMEEK